MSAFTRHLVIVQLLGLGHASTVFLCSSSPSPGLDQAFTVPLPSPRTGSCVHCPPLPGLSDAFTVAPLPGLGRVFTAPPPPPGLGHVFTMSLFPLEPTGWGDQRHKPLQRLKPAVDLGSVHFLTNPITGRCHESE